MKEIDRVYLYFCFFSFSKLGVFVLNLACRDIKLREELIASVKKVFPSISSLSIPEEINLVLFCFKSPNSAPTQKEFDQHIQSLNKRLKSKNNNKKLFHSKDMYSKLSIL